MTLRERILKAGELNEPEWFARGELAENRRLTPLILALADVADAAKRQNKKSPRVRMALNKLEQVVGDK